MGDWFIAYIHRAAFRLLLDRLELLVHGRNDARFGLLTKQRREDYTILTPAIPPLPNVSIELGREDNDLHDDLELSGEWTKVVCTL